MYARIPGYIKKVNVEMGDTVRKGAVLAELDVPEMEVDIQQKEALAQQAEAELKLAGSRIASDEADLRRRKSQFERLKRLGTSLLEEDAIDETQFGYEASKARLGEVLSDVALKEAQHKVALRNLEYSRAMLQYSKICTRTTALSPVAISTRATT